MADLIIAIVKMASVAATVKLLHVQISLVRIVENASSSEDHINVIALMAMLVKLARK